MARIPRKTQKIFAGSASNNGVFGSAADGTKVLSNDLATLQGKPAFLTGWLSAVIGDKKFPPLEEFQALNYINTSQLAYLFQEGIAAWDVGTTYFTNSIVKKAGTYELYGSKVDNNTGNTLPVGVSDANWQFLIDLSINSKVPYGICTGAANAYSVTTSPVFSSITDGLFFIAQINANNTNTTTLNPNATSNFPVWADGAALGGGELKAGVDYLFVCDAVNSRIQLVTPSLVAASTTRPGAIEIATPAEVIAQTDQTRALTPYNLEKLFSEVGRSNLATKGYLKLPGLGGLILQWGRFTVPPEGPGSRVTETFAIPFPSAVFGVYPSTQVLDPGGGLSTDQHNFVQLIGDPILASFDVQNQWVSGVNNQITVAYFAIGI